MIIQQKPGGTAWALQPAAKTGSDEQKSISLQTLRPWKSLQHYFFPLPIPTETSVVSVRAWCQTCAVNPQQPKQGSPSTPTGSALTHPQPMALAHRAFLKKLQFAQGKPNPSKPSPSRGDTLLPLPSDRGQLALPKTFAAPSSKPSPNIKQIHKKCTARDNQDVWRTSGTHREAGISAGLVDQRTRVLHPHLILKMMFENPWKPLNCQKETQIPQAGHYALILKLGLALRSGN